LREQPTERRKAVKTTILVAIVSLVIAAGAADSAAQTAGSTLISTEQLREVATGWSAKKQILGKDVYNDAGEKIGDINDLIVAPSRAVSYAIVGVGGFLGMGEHNVAVPVSKFKQQMGKIVLSGATKEALKAAPKFEYAK
jgi:sporulation protein YlmC with PRC-barrel domain